MKNKKRSGIRVFFKNVLAIMLSVAFAAAGLAIGINSYVQGFSSQKIIEPDAAAALENADCILVLGCLVKDNGAPSDMLADRLERGIELYKNGTAPKLLMSGDHGRKEYNEVGTMKQYAIDSGVPSVDIFMDHAGFSTYDSLYRAKEIFGAEKIVIVTQKYHLYRALHIAEQLGIEAYGVASDYHTYRGQIVRDVREVLARNKDFVISLFKPQAAILGDPILLTGSGDVTND